MSRHVVLGTALWVGLSVVASCIPLSVLGANPTATARDTTGLLLSKSSVDAPACGRTQLQSAEFTNGWPMRTIVHTHAIYTECPEQGAPVQQKILRLQGVVVNTLIAAAVSGIVMLTYGRLRRER